MYFNTKGDTSVTYDAIVVGSGISGGWAAKELCENGLKTLMLERGRMVVHPNYPTANDDPWDYPNRGYLSKEDLRNFPVQKRTGYTLDESTKHWWVNDLENPYTEHKRFDWIRGYHVGGRSIMWGRQSYRLSNIDFEANLKEGIAVDWPVRYKDIAPWYDHVEKFIGVSGQAEGKRQLPDSVFQPAMELNCVESHLREKLLKNYSDRFLTIGRVAHITEGTKGIRGSCQYRDRCVRGCPYGAYFSSNSSTLPAAHATGNLTLRPNSIVYRVEYDDKIQRATGVLIKDTDTGEFFEYKAKVIFLCASAVASTWIMLNSTSERFPNGLGADSGELGHNLMDHHYRCGASGGIDGFDDKYYKGRRPNGIYLMRFRNLTPESTTTKFIRGYGYQGGASRSNWMRSVRELGIGGEIKDAMMEPGPWRMGLGGFGECLPYHENRCWIDHSQVDRYGMPTMAFDAEYKDNENAMREDMKNSAAEMLEASGFKDVRTYDGGSPIGLGIHEMGTARMGRDPKTSVLNGNNQVHAVPNIYVTDGAFMTSSACQNPSLTYMAFSARAANHAVDSLKKGEL